jgi:hypothetical protein
MANQEDGNSDGVLNSIARSMGTTAGNIVVKATELTAKVAEASKSVRKKIAKKTAPKKKAKPAAKRKVVAKKKKAHKPAAKKRH